MKSRFSLIFILLVISLLAVSVASPVLASESEQTSIPCAPLAGKNGKYEYVAHVFKGDVLNCSYLLNAANPPNPQPAACAAHAGFNGEYHLTHKIFNAAKTRLQCFYALGGVIPTAIAENPCALLAGKSGKYEYKKHVFKGDDLNCVFVLDRSNPRNPQPAACAAHAGLTGEYRLVGKVFNATKTRLRCVFTPGGVIPPANT